MRGRELERLGHVGTVAGRLQSVTPHVQGLVGRAHPEGELAPGITGHHRARRPVDRALAVAFDVATEARADRGTGRTVQPLGLERLRAVAADLRHVAHEVPDLFRRCGDVDSHRVMHVATIRVAVCARPGRRSVRSGDTRRPRAVTHRRMTPMTRPECWQCLETQCELAHHPLRSERASAMLTARAGCCMGGDSYGCTRFRCATCRPRNRPVDPRADRANRSVS